MFNKKNPGEKKKKNKLAKIIAPITALILFQAILFSFYIKDKEKDENTRTYNEFIQLVEEGKVDKVYYNGSQNIEFTMIDDAEKSEKQREKFEAPNPRTDDFKQKMLEADVEFEEINPEKSFMSLIKDMVFIMMQYGLMMGTFFFLFKKMQGGTEDVEVTKESTKKFSDVAGLEEVKESLMTTVDMLKNPEVYRKAGARIPKGVLLYGPPGTGKTLLAKAIAGEAGVNFLAISGSDFDYKYVGVGADKVKKLFVKAKEVAPCIVFIDELDAVGTKRSGNDKAVERQTINQLLSCMDGFDESDGIFVFAATNDINAIDEALLRPGRFDSRFAVGLPDTAKDRESIIKLYLKNKNVSDDVSIATLAKQTIGYSPAGIEAMINEAAIESVKNNGVISQENLDTAFYNQLMNGHQKKNYERDTNELFITAWHEAGHAVMGYLLDQEVSKISIIPTTSGAGGVTIFNQQKMGMFSVEELKNEIAILYSGRNAEYMLLNDYDKVTTGASQDIVEATKIIKRMVNDFGMSKYSLLNLTQLEISNQDLMEEYTKIAKEQESRSLNLLQKNRNLLEKIAMVLIEKETINEEELNELFVEYEKNNQLIY